MRYYPALIGWTLKVKVGFHYPSWRAELTARVHGRPVSSTWVDGPSWRVSKNAPEFTGRKLGPWTLVVETDLDLCYMTAPHTLSVVIIIMLDGFIVVCYIVMTTHVFMLGMI